MKKQIQVWGDKQWVTILPGPKPGEHRVIPESGNEFILIDSGEEPIEDQIAKRLREEAKKREICIASSSVKTLVNQRFAPQPIETIR